MVKFSRKGWNNLIIVAVLLVITLLHKMELARHEHSKEQLRPLLPEAAVVLTWQGPHWQIERIGQGWRANAQLALTSTQLAELIERWQQWLLPVGTPIAGQPVPLLVWVAGQSQPINIGLYQNNGQYGALLADQHWLALSAEQYRSLLRPSD